MKAMIKTIMLVALMAVISPAMAGKMNYSVQLWSVRDAVEKDFKGTLKALADMGFDAVEFAGNYGGMEDDPAALKAFLDSIGLEASAAHARMHTYNDEEFDKWAKFFKAIGAKYIINPMDSRSWHPEQVAGFSEELNSLAERLKPYGLYTGYHNHAQEFAAFEGATFWDYVAKNTNEEVVLQLDVGWVHYAGFDPSVFVKRYKGRTITTHLKANLPKGAPEDALPIIGQDTLNWKKLLKSYKKYGGTIWYTVEQEEYPNGMSSLEAVEASFKGLKAIVAEL